MTTPIALPTSRWAESDPTITRPPAKKHRPNDSSVVMLKKMYVRTASVASGAAEYAKAIVICKDPDAVQVIVFVSKVPFDNMASIFSDMPIRRSAIPGTKLLQACCAMDPCEELKKVTKVSVSVFLPCPLSASISMYGVGVLCRTAFPNMDVEYPEVRVSYGQNHWVYQRAPRPREICTINHAPYICSI